MDKKSVAVLGLGTVGGGTSQILLERRETIKKEYDIDIDLKYILVRDIEKYAKKNIGKDLLIDNFDTIIKDSSVSIVAECIGGIEPAKTYIMECLKAGKSVVTANKELFAKHWLELEKIAKENQVGIYFEASSGGGIPIIRTLTEAFQANDVLELRAIINGTTNYILCRMQDEGVGYQEVLADAQALGYAEADPTADVEGFDASYKLTIMSTLVFNRYLNPKNIFREGISNITQADIYYGDKFGYKIKLLAIAKKIGKKIEARVHPVFIKKSHPLASVGGSFNAVMLKGNNVGDIMLYGRGAGDLPTGSAVVSDIVFAARKQKHPRYNGIENAFTNDDIISDFKSEYYINLSVTDRVGVLSKITDIFAKNNISIKSLYQEKLDENNLIPIIIFTHSINEESMQKALEKIKKLESVDKINNLIRVDK